MKRDQREERSDRQAISGEISENYDEGLLSKRLFKGGQTAIDE